MSKKYYVEQTSTCDRRRLDGQRIVNYLNSHGVEPTNDPNEADLVIALTCSTTRSNIIDSIDMVETLGRRTRADARIIMAGCLDKKLILDVPEDKVAVRINPKDGFLPIQQALGFPDSPYDSREFIQTQSYVLNVRVQDGCRGKCAFCDIRQKIGSSRSRSLDEIRGNVRLGLNDGVRLVRLVGDDVGTYGCDTGSDMAELLDAVLAEIGDRRIMIDNLDPRYLIEQWEQMRPILESGRVHHVKIPIQHFNERLLGLMRRFSDTQRIGELVRDLDAMHVQVQSHFIYGFPTETVDELMAAAADVISLPFGQVIFIPYSNKERVAAFRMPQITLDGMYERNARLKELLGSGDAVLEIEHVDVMGLEELVWVRKEYFAQRPATAF